VLHLMRMRFNGRCQIDCKLSRWTFSAENGRVLAKNEKTRKQNTFSSKNKTEQVSECVVS